MLDEPQMQTTVGLLPMPFREAEKAAAISGFVSPT